jgi:hypothetical protein
VNTRGKEAESKVPPDRIAILARQAPEWRIRTGSQNQGSGSGSALDAGLDEVVGHRMNQLGVVAGMVDYHSQIAQLFYEARRKLEDGKRYKSYVQRLDDWWAKWFLRTEEESSSTRGVSKLQFEHFEKVWDALTRIREILKFHDQPLRLQVWVRWGPGRESRKFKLWASSNGPIASADAMPEHAIEWDSSSPVVRAFCEGRLCLFGPLEGSRWRGGTVAAPIWLYDPRETLKYDAIPLGVVVLQSVKGVLTKPKLVPGRDTENLELYQWHHGVDARKREKLKETMRDLGRSILQIEPEEPAR